MRGRILIVDDDREMCGMLEESLVRREFQVEWHLRAEAALEQIHQQDFDVLLTDLNLPGMDGLELCRRVIEARDDLPVVVITAFGSLETAVGALRAGAYDFVTKPVDLDLLVFALERAIKQRRLQQQVRVLRESVRREQPFDDLLGQSRIMQELYDQLKRLAELDVTVLITGESGTGKDLAARALHNRGLRRGGPFVAVNCAALPENLLESELFGHVKGAFTGAGEARAGLFQQARGGTLFLDEIGEVPLNLQPKLLRALEQRKVRPVGATQEVTVDARFVTATNRDLEQDVADGRFREDLYYRLNVVPIEMPPLRARGTDILLLAEHFASQCAKRFDKKVTGLSQPVAEKLLSYSWPGNVRELRNAMERAVALTRFNTLAVGDLPDRIRDSQPGPMATDLAGPGELPSLAEVERRHIDRVLEAVEGNRTLAARILGLDRKTLYRKLRSKEK
ncbi:MAG: sigma-54-dependent transcriptional regulator [Geoalkalibacter sp.]|jgi:DNA-binding NtrC family response regulator|uniref:sigma-54-dependent transcriptional regulator n=1 Tax=Geoalkalibacter sp. TaxID=3041440 RepID=UPI002A950FB5|nr:sigma-54 dependent transcriptional regulator [Thermodesulfobacteriota bacterium]